VIRVAISWRVSGICPAGAGVRACSVAAVAVVSPQGTRRNDWDLPDPAGLTLDQVRPIGEDIERRVRILLAELTTAGTS
jgi:hypothetical protein